MYKPYKKPVSTVFPDVKIPEFRISRLVLFVVQIIGRIYLYTIIGAAKIVLGNGQMLFNVFRRALEGKSRALIAFRHPNGGEPQILMWYILIRMQKDAKKAGVKFCRKPFAHFVSGYEVLRWGGAVTRWALAGTGALPVYHSKVDKAGMDRIHKAVRDGPYPVAIAPEGQVSYNTETVPRLEQGTVRIGFRAAEELEKNGIDSPVEIVPVSFHLRYGNKGRRSLYKLLRVIEKYTGFKDDGAGLTVRLVRSRDFILAQNEKRYGIIPEASQGFNARVAILLEAALAKAEKIIDIKARSSDHFERLYYIRQCCWDRIIVPGLIGLDKIAPLERSIMDLHAGEAWHASRHMELADFVWYFRIPAPEPDAPLHILIEYAQNLFDFANRTMGGAYPDRVSIFPRKVIIQSGPVINLSERLPSYRADRKTAIAAAMGDLEKAYLDCIKESEGSERS